MESGCDLSAGDQRCIVHVIAKSTEAPERETNPVNGG